MSTTFRLFLLIALYALAGTAFATESATDVGLAFGWTSPPEDRSLIYLGEIFGTIGGLTGIDSGGIIANVFQIFNLAVLSIGAIVVSYTILLSTLNTAQEGEVMGRKWSSAWIPLRSAVGTALLIPAPQYSIIQVIFIQITIMGVHAANQIWQLVAESQTGVHGEIDVRVGSGSFDIAKDLFESMVCAAYLNEHYGGAGTELVVAAIDTSTDTLVVGIPQTRGGNITYKNLCGEYKPGSTPSGAFDSRSWKDAVLEALNSAASYLGGAAEEAVKYADDSNWTHVGALSQATNILKNGIASAPTRPVTDSDSRDKIAHGWIHAGSYYFAFADEGSNINTSWSPPGGVEEGSLEGYLSDTQKDEFDREVPVILNRYAQFTQEASGVNAATRNDSITIPVQGGLNSQLSEFSNAFTGPLQSLAWSFMQHLSTGAENELGSDPIGSVGKVGAEIMTTCEAIWLAIIIIAFVLLLAGCTMSGINPLCWAIGVIGTILMPFLSFLLATLWVIGATMAIYIPLIPFLVFTFTAIGWLILVIETVAAAPIVALGVVSPAQEVMGKAAPAILLITGVFLRPSLMLLGFIGAALLVRTVTTMINFAFHETVSANIAGVGVFGILALICLYGGLIMAIIHECFSLVYKLPDNILRWIGGQVEQSTVGQVVKDVEKDVQKGADIGSGLMKGTSQMAGKTISKAMEQQKGALGGMGGGGGGIGF